MAAEDYNHEKIFSTAAVIAEKLGKNNDFYNGYVDASKNVPLNYDYHDELRVAYIRGRAFALYSAAMKLPKASWRNGMLSKAATQRLVMAIQARAVI
jgi:hypothetical protein